MLLTAENQSSIFSCQQKVTDICDRSKVIYFRQKETIPQKTNSLWLIKKGVVKTLTWSETGHTIILGYWGEGDIIGLPLSQVEPYEVQCLNRVEAVSIPLQYGNHFFREIIYGIQQTDALLRIVRAEKMYDRLSQLLLWLGKKFGSPVLQGTLIDIRLTHQELADIIGSTRVTVTRLLNQLEKENAIIRPRRFAIIIKS